jgi:hypothetical protein
LYYKTVYATDDDELSVERLDSLAKYLQDNCKMPLLDIGGMDKKLAGRIPMLTSGAGDKLVGMYETVILSHTLEHVYDTYALVSEIKNHLVSGGKVVVEVPIWDETTDPNVYDRHWEHCNKFTVRNLQRLFVDNGFLILASVPLPDYREYHCHRLVAMKPETSPNIPVIVAGKKTSFYITKNLDSDEFFYQALLADGYVEELDMNKADFILYDGVHRNVEGILKHKPSFLFPHTPQSWFMFDGIVRQRPVLCNFVAGQAAVDGMKAYGYPFRVEAVGFNRCVVQEFRPSIGNDLLIVPAHQLQGGSYAENNYPVRVMNLLRKVLEKRDLFGRIELCWYEKDIDKDVLQDIRKKGVIITQTNPHVDKDPLKQMMKRIDKADLVLACGTAGCVSVAMGKPTVFFSEQGKPSSPPNKAALHSELYLDSIRFPLLAENMTIDQILAVRSAPDPRAEFWKSRNIGGQFDSVKFLRIIHECLKP